VPTPLVPTRRLLFRSCVECVVRSVRAVHVWPCVCVRVSCMGAPPRLRAIPPRRGVCELAAGVLCPRAQVFPRAALCASRRNCSSAAKARSNVT